jgi:hypothetical protein
LVWLKASDVLRGERLQPGEIRDIPLRLQGNDAILELEMNASVLAPRASDGRASIAYKEAEVRDRVHVAPTGPHQAPAAEQLNSAVAPGATVTPVAPAVPLIVSSTPL